MRSITREYDTSMIRVWYGYGPAFKTSKLRTPIFYMLLKIHKPNNPERPVISSVNSHTEKISACVDEFLRPLVQSLPSHFRDTTDLSIRLKNLGGVPENCILATSDVSSLYTNIDTDNGLAIIEKELAKTGQIQPSAKTLTCLLEKVLKLNNFTFVNHNFIQVKGTRAAPNLRTCIWAGLKIHLHTERNGPTT